MAEEENDNSKEETRRARLASARNASSRRKAMRAQAKKQIKKVVKKKVKKAVMKTIFQFLAWSSPVWGTILICLFAFLMLTYYVCEGSGLIAWVLKRTALGSLCSM